MVITGYYNFLAQKICFSSINYEEILQIASYKPGKNFNDVASAINQGKLEGNYNKENEVRCIGKHLSDVLELNLDFTKRLSSS